MPGPRENGYEPQGHQHACERIQGGFSTTRWLTISRFIADQCRPNLLMDKYMLILSKIAAPHVSEGIDMWSV